MRSLVRSIVFVEELILYILLLFISVTQILPASSTATPDGSWKPDILAIKVPLLSYLVTLLYFPLLLIPATHMLLSRVDTTPLYVLEDLFHKNTGFEPFISYLTSRASLLD